MSHRATAWAFAQRGLQPSTKIVLLHLADRHNPDHGCFPSQSRLAEDCELSRSSINRALDDLEAKGLIRREKRHDQKSGARLSTRYWLGFEIGDPLSQNETPPVSDRDTPCPAGDTAPVPPVTHEPVRGTSKRTSKADVDLFGDQKNQKLKEPEPVSILTEVISHELAEAFVQHRKEMRKAMTTTAAKQMRTRLQSMRDPAAAVRDAIANGWQGVFERDNPPSAPVRSGYDGVMARVRRYTQ